MKTKKYEVSISRVVDRITVEAKDEFEACEKAKKQVNYSVWESVAEEVYD